MRVNEPAGGAPQPRGARSFLGSTGATSGPIRVRRMHRDAWRLGISFLLTIFMQTAGVFALILLFPEFYLETFFTPDLELIPYANLAIGLWSLAIGEATFCVAYGLSTWLAFRRASGDRLRQLVRASSRGSDKSGVWLRLALMDNVSLPVWSAIICLGVVIMFIGAPESRNVAGSLIAALIVIISCWLVVISTFAVKYMRLWAENDAFEFHGDDDVELSDFLYTAVQVGTTFSTSDVMTASASARRWVTLNAVLAFAFNTVIIVLFLSIASSGWSGA